MVESAYDRICRALSLVTDGTGRGGQWPCPAHDDRNPSLSVSHGREGVVLHCHAGCTTSDVLAKLGLTEADLFDEPRTNGQAKPEIDTTYDYTDEAGHLLYQVVRYRPKDFRQRRPDGKGGWIWNLKGARRVLYKLPDVLSAVASGEGVVWLCEGEKDADAVTRAVAGTHDAATTCPHGAGKWRPEYTQTLAGHQGIIVISDKDETGYRHARNVAKELRAAGCHVTLVEPHTGKDVADHLGAGLTLDDLDPLYDGDDLHVDPDIDDFLAQPEPDYAWIIDDLVERGDRVIVTGPEGGGKSTLLRQISMQAASGIHPFTLAPIAPLQVLYVDTENSTRQARRAFRGLRQVAGNEYVRGRLRVRVLGHAINLAEEATYLDLAARITTQEVDLLVIGPLYKLIHDDPVKELPAKAVADAIDYLRSIRGSAVLIEAHSPYAEGSKAKRPIRPYGASLWSRWPEFGIYLDPEGGGLRHWRGQRDERAWPDRLERAEPWPWAAGTPADGGGWHGPTQCADAIVALLLETGDEMSTKRLQTELRARGRGFRPQTVADAAAIAQQRGDLAARTGPRNARLYSAAQPPKADDALDF